MFKFFPFRENESCIDCLNPLKRVKFISMEAYALELSCATYVSIPSNGSSLFQCRWEPRFRHRKGQKVSIPSNGSSLFQFMSISKTGQKTD